MMLPASSLFHVSVLLLSSLSRALQSIPVNVLGRAGSGETYPRLALLGKEKILLTWQMGNPVFKSVDSGATWKNLSSVAGGFQPFVYVLPKALGSFKAGTVLFAYNDPSANATHIRLSASSDEGLSWNHVSTITVGLKKPVWEPTLLYYDGQLLCYFSDERDPEYSQKLSLQTSKDGITWSEPSNAVAEPKASDRPGMANVAQLGDGSFILVYEYGGAPEGNYTIYYKRAKTPLQFGPASRKLLKPTEGEYPIASPNVVWTPYGGPQGTIVVAAATSKNLFLNTRGGEGLWTILETASHKTYAPALAVSPMDPSVIYIAAGATIGSKDAPMTFVTQALPKADPSTSA